MGTRLISQRRGRGSPTYRAASHRYFGRIILPKGQKEMTGEVLELVNSIGHPAPLMIVRFEDNQMSLLPAPLGISKGDHISYLRNEIKLGNIIKLGDVPSGTLVCNIENTPFDGGKFLRTSGTSASVITREEDKVLLKMPSKKNVKFNPNCRAIVGTVAGGGRKEKPFVKAGKRAKAMRARNKLYPRVSGVAMNAKDHPYGGTHRRTKGRPSTTKRGTPPGRTVGLLAARKTGRGKKRK